jgi:hypothetical protein
MSKRVADLLVETLQAAGIKTCYGVVGDTLNRITHAIDRSEIDWVHMRHEEAGASTTPPLGSFVRLARCRVVAVLLGIATGPRRVAADDIGASFIRALGTQALAVIGAPGYAPRCQDRLFRRHDPAGFRSVRHLPVCARTVLAGRQPGRTAGVLKSVHAATYQFLRPTARADGLGGFCRDRQPGRCRRGRRHQPCRFRASSQHEAIRKDLWLKRPVIDSGRLLAPKMAVLGRAFRSNSV